MTTTHPIAALRLPHLTEQGLYRLQMALAALALTLSIGGVALLV